MTSQRELVRVAVSGTRIVLDPKRALPGRGAYVHPRASCVTIPGLSRAMKRSVTKADLDRIVAAISEMSPSSDNRAVKSADRVEPIDDPSEKAPGLAGAITVETTPRIKAKDERTEDARV